ncbi:MAG: hypothetical protein V3S64_01475 [bacterium]
MTQLIYTEAELARDHDYARPHIEGGYRLHGGFDEKGGYVSPRLVGRGPAVAAWQARLRGDGWELIDADARLLTTPPYPTFGQQKLMLWHGLHQTLWNSLTITGIIEGRGRMLMDYWSPDFQEIVLEDVSQTATGHLNKGLLRFHGMDEGGDPDSAIGGHDVMWFAARDMLLGKDAFPIPEPPERTGRPESDEQRIPEIPPQHEFTIDLLMNVLMIEVRAEHTFNRNIRLMRDPALFRENQADAEAAAELVARIQQDEKIHVEYLRTVISELRAFTFIGGDDGHIPGTRLIDPAWDAMVHWHAEENPRLQREQMYPGFEWRILELENGEHILAEFNALDG